MSNYNDPLREDRLRSVQECIRLGKSVIVVFDGDYDRTAVWRQVWAHTGNGFVEGNEETYAERGLLRYENGSEVRFVRFEVENMEGFGADLVVYSNRVEAWIHRVNCLRALMAKNPR